MKLLVLTQKVNKNDPILGFFHRWLEEFSKRFEKITVICLEEGEYKLPENVKVFSLGKVASSATRRGDGKFIVPRTSYIATRLKYVWKFYKYIWQERKNYDAVFVHMNPEYIALGGLFWKLFNKKVYLWYTHRQKNLKLWVAEKFSNLIFTSSKYSFTLKSNKINVIGHAIDTDFFAAINKKKVGQKIILHMGRITKIKNCHILIEALRILKEKWEANFKLKFVGDVITKKDIGYKKELIKLIEKYDMEDIVEFVGPIAPMDIGPFYSESFATANLSPTGGVDKSVLESLAAGVPCFASNLAFLDIYGEYRDIYMFREADSYDLSEKIIKYSEIKDDSILESELRKKVLDNFGVINIVEKIFKVIENEAKR